jgi:hypothetical protein
MSCVAPSNHQLRDAREMMIIVFGHEQSEVNQPHRRAKPRMESGTRKDRIIRSSQELHELGPCGAKGRKEIRQLASVVVRLVSPTIRQVGRHKLGIAYKELLCAAQPERLEIEEVPDIFLHGPALIVAPGKNVFGQEASALLDPCRRTSEPFDETRKATHGQSEIERALKPLLSFHSRIPSLKRRRWLLARCALTARAEPQRASASRSRGECT